MFIWQSETVLTLLPSEYFGSAPDIGAIESDLTTTGYFSELKPIFHFYPNPGNGILNIDLKNKSNDIKLEIINSNGKIIKSQKLPERKNQIDISGYSEGLYIIKLTGYEINISKKIVLY